MIHSALIQDFLPLQEVRQSPKHETTLHSLKEVYGPSLNYHGLEMGKYSFK